MSGASCAEARPHGNPVILCDEWTPAQVKAFRLMVNRSVPWADWDEELLALELQEIQESDLALTLTGFGPGEIDALLALDDDDKWNAAPPLPESPLPARLLRFTDGGELFHGALRPIVRAIGFHGANRVVVGCPRHEVVYAHAENRQWVVRV
jgi:hypothetical protein